MKKVDTLFEEAFLTLEIRSIARGYKAMNSISAEGKVSRILDASPAGDRFLILATGQEEKLKASVQDVRLWLERESVDLVVDWEVLPMVHRSVYDAAFSLAQTPFEESLLVVECSTVSGCFAVAQDIVAGFGLRPIELKIRRTSAGGAYVLFTGKSTECALAAEHARKKLEHAVRQGRVELVDQPSRQFLDYFVLSTAGA
jgi:hypothetical protein